jgi:hypothetical protein
MSEPGGPSGEQPQYGQQPPPYGEQQPPQYGQPRYGEQQPPQYGQPQYGEQQPPQYGQPQYGDQPPQYPPAQPYGQQPPQYGQPYGQQYAPGQAYPGAPWAPAEQPKSSKKKWIVVVAAVVVAAIVAVILVAAFSNSDSHKSEEKTAGRSVALPASFDSYNKISSLDTDSLKTQIAGQLSALGAGASAADNAKVGAYSTSGAVPQVIFLGFRVQDVPKLQSQLKDIGTAAAVKQFTDGVSKGVTGQGGQAGGSAKSYDPGKLGGAMRCQQASLATKSVGLCTWGDRSYFSLTLVIGSPSANSTATVTRDLRNASEH